MLMMLGMPGVCSARMTSLGGSPYTWRTGNNSNFSLHFGPSIGVESGDMTYTISGPEDGGWRSELEWPLEGILYAGGTLSARIAGRFHLSAGVWKDLQTDAGTMKDSDWFDEYSALFEYYTGDDRAIYGEFESTVNAVQFDVKGQYDAVQLSSLVIGVVMGYAASTLNWTADDGFQRSPIPDYNAGPIRLPYQGDEHGITYEEKLSVPYAGVAVSLAPMQSPLGIDAYILYSPIAQCDDIDDHLLRDKENVGTSDGTFFSVGGSFSWKFLPSFALTGAVDYTVYDLEGKQDQYFYAGENAGTRYNDIDLTVEGSQVSLSLMVGYTL